MKRAKTARRTHPIPAATDSSAATTVSVPVGPPRNPYATLAHQRRAGVHGGNTRTRRQAEKRELRRKLAEE